MIKRIDDLENDDRSSYLNPICYQFHKSNMIGYGDYDLPVPDHYNNWQIFNNDSWDLVCKFDEHALGREHYDAAKKHQTYITIEYKLYFTGNETIEEVLKTIEQHPCYGDFTGIKQLHGCTYELMWGT